MSTDGDTILRLRPDATAWLATEGETVLLDLEHARYLGVNRSGTLLWSALAQGCTRAELVTALQQAYALPAHDAERDVDAFVQVCRDRDLLDG